MCCATRKIWRSYCRTSCSNAAESPAFARATSATSGWISSVTGDWMAGMRKGCEKRTLNSLAQRCNEISAYTIVNAAGTESNEGAQSCGLTRRDFEDSDAEKMRN